MFFLSSSLRLVPSALRVGTVQQKVANVYRVLHIIAHILQAFPATQLISTGGRARLLLAAV